MLVCLDTHILIWGVQGKARPTQVEMIEKTKKYLRFLDNNDFTVIVPSVSLGEYLIHFTEEAERLRRAQEISERFIIGNYDALASAAFSRVWNRNASKEAREVLREGGIVRNHVTADCMIVATALRYKCDFICSQDRPMQRMAEGLIEVKEVSPIAGSSFEEDPAMEAMPLFEE